ncbi:MAG: patatin-like phospholipase RssA [Zoogloea sp.]|nr:patatin-like phospholipase RssA [Zoogloea sp.]
MNPRPRIALVLGSGSARGWAHIGVMRALARAGIEPDILCGCSIGALVGAVAAHGDLDKLARWVERLAWQDVVGLLDLGLRGGLLKGDKLIAFFEQHFLSSDFSKLTLPFACVATDLNTGQEVWLREGSLTNAVRASLAMPGLFTPVVRDGRLMVDGALVNPVPVSLARALGAEVVIAIDLGSDLLGRGWRGQGVGEAAFGNAFAGWSQKLLNRFGVTGGRDESGVNLPSMLDVMHTSISIMSVRIARSRLAGEPADVLLTPRVGQIGLMDYHRGVEAIAQGEAVVERMLPAIHHALGE